jgi:GNAT superfamily N-acetyltransferase
MKSIKILDYNEVDPLQVLQVTLLALGFRFTPEHAAHILRTDPRPFPCFTVNAVEEGAVLGQVGVFRLPMISRDGREDVGGVWAVSTHPNHAGRGVATALLEEAHDRMRAAGLRFSTLGTSRSGIAYRLYQKLGYVDMNVWATAFARWEVAHQPTRLRAQPAGDCGYDLAEQVFASAARDCLGFAWRHTPFASLRDKVKVEDILILWENDQPLGYALISTDQHVLNISDLLLNNHVNPTEAVAAVVSHTKTAYVQVRVSRPGAISSLRQAGYQVAYPDWGAFMVKPLLPEVPAEEARRIFGIGTDRFLISWLDAT